MIYQYFLRFGQILTNWSADRKTHEANSSHLIEVYYQPTSRLLLCVLNNAISVLRSKTDNQSYLSQMFFCLTGCYPYRCYFRQHMNIIFWQWVTLWSGVLPTKFGGYTAFLSNLTSGWPWLTRAWPLTPAMHYALVRDSSYQFWWPLGISKQFDPWLTPMTPAWPLTPVVYYALVGIFNRISNWQS